MNSLMQLVRGRDAAIAQGTTREIKPYLVFDTLYAETLAESSIRAKVGDALCANPRARVEDLVKREGITTDDMRIFRWARFAAICDPDHALLPLFWQVFFCLYFAARSVTVAGVPILRGYGHIVFSSSRAGIATSLQNRLAYLAQHHRASASRAEQQAQEAQRVEHAFLSRLYVAFENWLGEPRLSARSLALATLPESFCLAELQSVMEGDAECTGLPRRLWTHLVSGQLSRERDLERADWLRFIDEARVRVPRSTASAALDAGSPPARGAVLLVSAQTPFAPVVPRALSIPVSVAFDAEFASTPIDVEARVSADLGELRRAAENHATRLTAVRRLDAAYIAELPSEYINERLTFQTTGTCARGPACTRPAQFEFVLMQMKARVDVKARLRQVHTETAKMYSNRVLDDVVCAAAMRIRHVARALVERAGQHDGPTARHGVAHSARQMVYLLLAHLDGCTEAYAPSRLVVTEGLQLLGEHYIRHDAEQMPRILDEILRAPHRSRMLLGLFEPANAVDVFAVLYTRASEACARLPPQEMVDLLRKFDMAAWLSHPRQRLSERYVFPLSDSA